MPSEKPVCFRPIIWNTTWLCLAASSCTSEGHLLEGQNVWPKPTAITRWLVITDHQEYWRLGSKEKAVLWISCKTLFWNIPETKDWGFETTILKKPRRKTVTAVLSNHSLTGKGHDPKRLGSFSQTPFVKIIGSCSLLPNFSSPPYSACLP